MSNNPSSKNFSRRSFLKLFSGSFLAYPTFLLTKNLFAADAKTLPAKAKALDENAPMAKALGYKADSKKVDTARFKKFVAGQNCSNCSQYTKKNDNWGECKIIKGGLVSKDGWCSSYVAAKK